MRKADIIGGILGIGLSVYVLWTASSFPEDQVLLLGPSFFPTLLSIALGLLSVILLLRALFSGKTFRTQESFSLKDPGIRRAGVSLLATIIYCGALPYVGFLLGSFLYLIFLMYLLKQRQYLKMATISLGVTLAVFGIFRIVLNITLPLGFFG